MKALFETYVVQSDGGKQRHIPVTFSKFPDGDTHCVITDAKKFRSASVLVVHYLYPNQNEQLVKLMLLLDLLRDLGATEVSVFVPYLPYSRQDKRHVAGEALGMHTVCRMLAAAACARLYVIDCHFMRGTAKGVYDGLEIINISATEILLEMCRSKYIGDAPYHVVGPDKGASMLGDSVSQHMHKVRGDYAAGRTSQREISALAAEHISIKHEAIVIIDDMVSTGGTMLRAVEALYAKGSKQVYCVATHGLFLGDSFAKLSRATDGVMAGDTVPHTAGQPITAKLLHDVVVPHWQNI